MNNNIELMDKLYRTSRLIHQSHHQSIEKSNASCRGQGRVLSLLKSHPEITQKKLASIMNIRSQSLGELLVKLEKNGCILRSPSEKDHRVMNIKLTSKGLEAAERADKNKENTAKRLDCLNDEEKLKLEDILNRLTGEFEKDMDNR